MAMCRSYDWSPKLKRTRFNITNNWEALLSRLSLAAFWQIKKSSRRRLPSRHYYLDDTNWDIKILLPAGSESKQNTVIYMRKYYWLSSSNATFGTAKISHTRINQSSIVVIRINIYYAHASFYHQGIQHCTEHTTYVTDMCINLWLQTKINYHSL
jgi:hypothetical protein